MFLLGHEAQVEARFGLFGDRLVLMQGWCMVCIERTIGLEIVWTHPMEHVGHVAHVESRFRPFRDSVSVRAR
jgi:hypothetical protein